MRGFLLGKTFHDPEQSAAFTVWPERQIPRKINSSGKIFFTTILSLKLLKTILELKTQS